MKNIKQQFEEMKQLPIFEFEVIDKRTNNKDYVLFNIEINKSNNTFEASHIALTKEEEESKFIAMEILNIDDDVSLDTHLSQLYEDCINSIMYSDFYELI